MGVYKGVCCAVALFECKLWQIIISLLLLLPLLLLWLCVCLSVVCLADDIFTSSKGFYDINSCRWQIIVAIILAATELGPKAEGRQRHVESRPYQMWGGSLQGVYSTLWAIRVCCQHNGGTGGVVLLVRTRLPFPLCTRAALCVQLEIVNNVVIAFGPLSLLLLLMLLVLHMWPAT